MLGKSGLPWEAAVKLYSTLSVNSSRSLPGSAIQNEEKLIGDESCQACLVTKMVEDPGLLIDYSSPSSALQFYLFLSILCCIFFF